MPFAAILRASGNAPLAASLSSIAAYRLAAIFMYLLLVRLGSSDLASWFAGPSFALGPLRVPGNLQILPYPNLFLPMVALATVGLRREPRAGRTGSGAGADARPAPLTARS